MIILKSMYDLHFIFEFGLNSRSMCFLKCFFCKSYDTMSRPLLSPVASTTSKEYRGDVCMLCSKPCKEERRDLNSWNNLKCIAESWKYIEPYGKLYDDTNWDSGPSGHFIHKLCRLEVSTKSLERNKRKQEEESW